MTSWTFHHISCDPPFREKILQSVRAGTDVISGFSFPSLDNIAVGAPVLTPGESSAFSFGFTHGFHICISPETSGLVNEGASKNNHVAASIDSCR